MLQKLQEQFSGKGEVEGFEFKQIYRKENSAVYEVCGGEPTHYEVIRIKKSPVCLDFVNRIYSDTEFTELYPKAKAFGDFG